MKKILSFIFGLLVLSFFSSNAFAVYGPTDRQNNKFGIHILFRSELEKAAKLVNSSGGDWGYVTVPIQYGDRDLERWQSFMDEARKHHLIPIIRLATESYYKDSSVWRKPTYADVLDFANFLNSLDWPVINRYVVLFNEVNRFDEWGGDSPNPEGYTDIVEYAIEVFKNRSQDFFLITAGLDNGAPNDGVKFLDNLAYLRRIGSHNAQVFAQIDGIASHSYPNPAFREPPSRNLVEGTSTYKYENQVIERFGGTRKPVFITETGWDAAVLGEDRVASYFLQANQIWFEDEEIMAVTPFILESQNGSFDKFTFFKNGEYTTYGKVFQSFPKKDGNPVLNQILAREDKEISFVPQKKNFRDVSVFLSDLQNSSGLLKAYFKATLGLIHEDVVK